MKYVELEKLLHPITPQKHMAKFFLLPSGETFYIEPVFHTQLLRLLEKFPTEEERIISEMLRVVKNEKQIIFTGNYEIPLVDQPGYIYRELIDITNHLGILLNDISRGSDYGD